MLLLHYQFHFFFSPSEARANVPSALFFLRHELHGQALVGVTADTPAILRPCLLLSLLLWSSLELGEKQRGTERSGGKGLTHSPPLSVWSVSPLQAYRPGGRNEETPPAGPHAPPTWLLPGSLKVSMYHFKHPEVIFGLSIFCLLSFTYLTAVDILLPKSRIDTLRPPYRLHTGFPRIVEPNGNCALHHTGEAPCQAPAQFPQSC